MLANRCIELTFVPSYSSPDCHDQKFTQNTSRLLRTKNQILPILMYVDQTTLALEQADGVGLKPALVTELVPQDDKGLVAICVAGMPPFSPHADDPARAVLATLEARASLSALGVGAAAGISTGAAYSGFVGGPHRREMCAMGSTVNMAARLMGLAAAAGRAGGGGGRVLVDCATRNRSALRVGFASRGTATVKGRDSPLEVFEALAPREPAAAAREALSLAASALGVRRGISGLSEELQGHLEESVASRDDCCAAHVVSVTGPYI